MKQISLARTAMTILLLVITAIPALANHLTTATGTADCNKYTVTVNGADLDPKTATVSYKITLTPSTGTPIVVSDGLTVTKNSSNFFKGTATQNWSKYGLALSGNYKITASAHLDVPSGNTIPIVFTPATLSCSVSTCLATSSLSVLAQGSKVTSYAPNGSWSSGITGVQVVPLEPVGTPTSIVTPNIVNSCSSNSATGETVCVANNTDVYLITGSTLNTTLTSGANSGATFSGGTCENCGVAVNSNTNTAVITIGDSGAPSGSGLQYLNLANNTFATPIPANNEISEDVLWDQTRNLILSPNEDGVYDVFQVTSSATTEYANNLGFGEGDSAAEDCSTGIALSSLEFTDQLFIADLTQAVYTVGPPGTWTTTAEQVQTFPEFSDFSAGTTGIAVAQNGSHLGVVTSEFGGNAFGAFQLPSTSGSGVPSVVDYASAVLPNTPDGNVWNIGLDPHTVTAYVSPNNGKAYGVMANGYFAPPTYLAVVDLQALLLAPRLSGTHTVDPTYDLIVNNVLVYVAAQ